MSIQILSQSASIFPLNELGVVARPLTQPPCQMRGLDISLLGAGENDCGIWECDPGRFERQLVQAEVMHILSGACSFTPDGETPLEIKAGDTLFFPAHTTGIWHIRETLRKVYVVLALPT